MRKNVLAAIVLCVCVLMSYGQSQQLVKPDRTAKMDKYFNPITTAVPFLMIAPDARAAGMGDIGSCSSADVNSQHHNPSKYVFNKSKFGVSFSYSPWLTSLSRSLGIHMTYLSAFGKLTDMDAIAFSLRYFHVGTVDFTDETGYIYATPSPNEFAIDFTYARKLTDVFSMALTPRFIYSAITAGYSLTDDRGKAGLAGAADLSLFYEQDFRTKGMENSTLRLGVNISNMGNKMTYSSDPSPEARDFLPANLKIGLSYTMDFDGFNSISILGEMNKLLVPTPPKYERDSLGNRYIAAGKSNKVSSAQGIFQSFYDAPAGFMEELYELAWSFGIEYAYDNLLFVRTGGFFESKYKGNRKYLTFGVGLHYNIFQVDVSYLFTVSGQHHPLEHTLRFSLAFDLKSFKKDEIKTQDKMMRSL
ncbi:MAG: type IX secretion system outer membrane channel protein PorV [Bacteroidales bacterium]|nr:type IX secretion system outer membrane channel protein PorV [Bacteroidales bacterium]